MRQHPDGYAKPQPKGSGAGSIAVERLLTVAVALCVALLLAGVVLSLLSGQALPHDVVGVRGLVGGLVHRSPAAYLTLGMLLLLASPILRVVGSLILFARERDWRYVMVSAVVCGVIVVSGVVGRG